MAAALIYPPGSFVILSYPRCGTHLLQTALDSHLDLRCAGEIFNPTAVDGDGLSVGEGVLRLCKYAWGAGYAGFCVHTYLGVRGRSVFTGPALPRHRRDLWSFLEHACQHGVVPIAIERPNLFARFLSHWWARRRQVWLAESRPGDPPAGPLSVSQFLQDAEYVEECHRRRRRLFPQALTLRYREPTGFSDTDYAAVLSRLRVAPRALQPRTVKILPPWRSLVTNLDEIRAAVRGTPYAEYLTDG